MSEIAGDMENVETWIEVVADMLCWMQAEHLLPTLRLALEKEAASATERKKEWRLHLHEI
jgi:hypothetical protein